jgi:hypothetical protein
MICGNKTHFKHHGRQRGMPPIIGFVMFALVIMILVKASWVLLPIGLLLFGGMLKRSAHGHTTEERDERIEDYLRKRKNDEYYDDESPKRKNDEDDIYYV